MENIFEKPCRLCVKNINEGVHLFNTTISTSQTLVADFLRQITSLEISENDDLTDVMCTVCFQKLCDAFNFVQMCIASDTILRNITKEELKDIEVFEIRCESEADQKVYKWLKSEENVIDQESEAYSDLAKSFEYSCGVCKVYFNNKKEYDKHKKCDDVEDPLKIDDYSRTLRKKVHLVQLQSHNKDKVHKFNCKICSKKFKSEHLLKKHEYQHTKEKYYPCKICSKGCITADSLKRHMVVHDENFVKKKPCCEFCFKEFASPSALGQHAKIHSGEKPHLCTICGKRFCQRGNLHYHQKIHNGDKPFICKICNKKFITQSALNVHMRRHTNERPYVCHICGMAFARSTDCRRHQITHTGDKPVLCTVCGKRTSTTTHLKVHMRIHTKEKPFMCSHCSKTFTTKSILVKHVRIHTGERPYVCDVCGKAFNQRSTLKTHGNIHQKIKKTRKNKKEEEDNLNEVTVKDYNNVNCDTIKTEIEFVTVNLKNEKVQTIKVEEH